MKLHSLQKTTTSAKKRKGRGYGSGVGGHTVGRGQKGQKSRSSVPLWFEGGQLPQIKRLPFQRGKNRFKSLAKDPILVSLSQLEVFPSKTVVSLKALIEAGIVGEKEASRRPVKVLGNGEVSKALTIAVPISKLAQAKVEQAGGSVDRGQAV